MRGYALPRSLQSIAAERRESVVIFKQFRVHFVKPRHEKGGPRLSRVPPFAWSAAGSAAHVCLYAIKNQIA